VADSEQQHLHVNHVKGFLGSTEAVATSAKCALRLLNSAIGYFQHQGLDAWQLSARVQAVKALADLHEWDTCHYLIDVCWKKLKRFSILESHLQEAIGGWTEC
jgi:hypothetical protein